MTRRPESNKALNTKVSDFINGIKEIVDSNDLYQPARIVLNNGRFVYVIDGMEFAGCPQGSPEDYTQTERIMSEAYDKIKNLAETSDIAINLDISSSFKYDEEAIGGCGMTRGYMTNVLSIKAEFTIPRPRSNTNG